MSLVNQPSFGMYAFVLEFNSKRRSIFISKGKYSQRIILLAWFLKWASCFLSPKNFQIWSNKEIYLRVNTSCKKLLKSTIVLFSTYLFLSTESIKNLPLSTKRLQLFTTKWETLTLPSYLLKPVAKSMSIYLALSMCKQFRHISWLEFTNSQGEGSMQLKLTWSKQYT